MDRLKYDYEAPHMNIESKEIIRQCVIEELVKAFHIRSQQTCDVKFLCSDGEIFTHSYVMAIVSPMLKEILQKKWDGEATLHFKNIRSADLENVLKVVYIGTSKFNKAELDAFFDVLFKLEIGQDAYSNIVVEENEKAEASSSKLTTEKEFIVEFLSDGVWKKETHHQIEKSPSKTKCTFLPARHHSLYDYGNAVKTPYYCEVCSKCYENLEELDDHFNEFHSGPNFDLPCYEPSISSHTCEICFGILKTRKALEEHREFVHQLGT